MSVPTNDARALHDLLERLHQSAPRPSAAWPEILGADWETLEFTRRHSEVVALYNGTLRQVASLPDKTRARAERYAWAWWIAVIAPNHTWGGNMQSSAVVDDWALDHLGTVADLIEARMSGSLVAPNKTDLGDLRDVCQEWVDAVLEEAGLADALKMNLLQDLRHIMWLIDNADIFGVARVAATAETVVGNVIVTGQALPEAQRGVWIARGKKLLAAIVYLGALYQGFDVSWAIASDAGNFIGELTAGSSASVPVAPGPTDQT